MKNNKKFTINKTTNRVGVTDLSTTDLFDKPVPGFYKIIEVQIGMAIHAYIEQNKVNIPTSAKITSKHVLNINSILNFLSEDSKRIHNSMGIPAKYGIILYGKQGTGKTTTMLACAQILIEQHKALAIEIDGVDDLNIAYKFIKDCQELNPDQLFIILHDECDYSMSSHETEMKKYLDGTDTPNNLIYIGTTNYIEKIPKTILKRPSRIKEAIDCSNLNDEEEIIFGILNEMNTSLDIKDQLSREQIVKLCPDNKGKTIDELKHLFLESALQSKDETLKTTKKVQKKSPKKVKEPEEMS